MRKILVTITRTTTSIEKTTVATEVSDETWAFMQRDPEAVRLGWANAPGPDDSEWHRVSITVERDVSWTDGGEL